MDKNIRNYLREQEPLFAFNIWDINSAKAVIDAAAQQKKNVILQTSASIYNEMDKKQLREFVSSYAEEVQLKVWLHLDHCRKQELIYDAIEHDWDSVMIDASDRNLDENIEVTNRIIKEAHEQGVLVEAEVGQVKGVEDDIQVCKETVASCKDIDTFLQETNVDMIAIAFGNAHGIYSGEPKLHYELVEYTVEHYDIPFVVHGGSGLSNEVLNRLLSIAGVKKINISTDVKLAYREGILAAYEKGLLQKDGFQAVKVEKIIHGVIANMVAEKLALLD